MEDGDDRELGFLLYDAARLLRRDFDRRAKGLGLSRAQWSVLAHLARQEGVKQAELAELLDVQPITLARQLDRLEAGGWVRRCYDPQDRRVRRLYLTEDALPVLEDLRELGRQTRSLALQGLDGEDRRQLLNLLSVVRGNLAAGGFTNNE
ncbi:MAG: MarR family transcriptional regulator [Ectothiorhodospiraceae bacterium]